MSRNASWAREAASALFGGAGGVRSDPDPRGESDEDASDSRPPAQGLRAGEVVAFAVDGLPYVVDRNAAGEAVAFGPSALEDAVSIADPATHLVVVRQGRFLGFRSELCGGKMLQARHRARGRLCFYNLNHGINEQWETPDELPGDDWRSCAMRLKNRRLPSCVLAVEVMRVPADMAGAAPPSAARPTPRAPRVDADEPDDVGDAETETETARASNAGESRAASRGGATRDAGERDRPVARMVAFHEQTIERGAAAGSIPTSPAAWESQAPPGSTVTREAASRFDRRGSPGAGGAEQGHALKSMSGVLIKEWSAFVLKEVRARKEVEAQMLALREEMRGMLATVRGDIDRQREEWIGDAAYYGANVRDALEKSARQRQRAVEMARKTFGRRWTVSVFGRWRDVTADRRRRRVAANRAMGRIMHLRLASPFHSWIAKVQDSRRARRALSKMSGMNARNRTARAFAAWKRAAVVGMRSRRHDRLVELLRIRAATKMRRREMSRAFSGWEAKVSELRRMRAVGTKIAARWMRSSMADFFFAWFQLSRGKRRRRERLSALVLRVFERKRHAAFITWAQAVKRVKRERHLVRIVGARLAKGTLRQSFAAWTAESGARASKRRRARDFARRVFLRWSFTSTTRAFERWRDAARTTRVARAKANATLLRWRRRDLQAAFSEWATTTLYRLAARDNAMLFAVRIARSSAHKAFRTWRDAVADLAHRRATLERMVTRWMTHRLASAFDGWAETAAAMRVRRAKMRSLIWRIRFAAAGKAFRSWRRRVELLDRARLAVVHATAPSTVRALSAAFRGWRFQCDATRRKRALAKKVVAKMRNLRTDAAFRAWRVSVRDKADKRALVGRVVARMTRVKLASAWDRWETAADVLRRERDALFRADRFARRRAEDRAERAAEAFLDQLRRAASFRRRAHRAVVRIRASVCSRAFAKWIFVVDERRRAASLFAKGARRFERVLLSKTIRAWYFACDDVQRERAVFAKAARKLDVLRLRRWWREWRTVAGEGLAERAAARRAIRRWTKGSLGGAWRKWTSHVDRERVKARAARTHAAIKSAVARERTLRASWTSWREHVAYYRRASALVSKAYAKTCRLQKQSVFDQWLDFVREVEARKETLKRCVTSKRLLTSWFLDWYWKAFEGDISSALGAITDSAEDVIGTVYGDSRGVDRGVFQQWQMLGSSLEAMTARPAEDAARAAAEKWRRARVFRGEDEPDADSPLGDGDGERTPGTPSSEAFDRSGYASGASTPRADESFRSADALDLSLSRQSSVATPTRFADDADARRTPRTASTRRPSASARETLAMSSSSESDDGFARPSPTASSTASESRRRWTRAATDIDDDGTDEDASPDPRRLTRSPATRRR